MPAKLGAQCAFGMFIAILMTGIFQEARATDRREETTSV
jgi:hypothetical protein